MPDSAQTSRDHSNDATSRLDPHHEMVGILPAEADVVVVGGGVAGCSVAYQLAKRGKGVLLAEMRGICSGASGRNAGVTSSGSAMYSRTGQAVYRLTSENFRMLRDELPAELNSDFDLRVTGTVDIATNDVELEHLAATMVALQAGTDDVQLLDRHQLKSLIPAISDNARGAKFSRNGGHVWPFKIVNALAAGARRHGARIFPWTRVEEILTRNGTITGVRTTRGTVATDTVVVATNAWTPLILRDLPRGAIVPARGQILVTQPVGPILPYPFGTNFDKEYGRQTASGQLLCGGYRRLDDNEGLGHYEERVSLASASGCADCLRTLFPRVGPIRIVRCWAGIMGFTADGLPLIGSYGDARGLFAMAGFNGGGFAWALVTGKVIAGLAVDGTSPYDISPFDPNRFAGGRVDWDNPFTAGEKSNPRDPSTAMSARTGDRASNE